MSFTGNATAHVNANDINNLTVTFSNGDFTGGSAVVIANATKSDLSIDFNDSPAPVDSTSFSTVIFNTSDGSYNRQLFQTNDLAFKDHAGLDTHADSSTDEWYHSDYLGTFTLPNTESMPVYRLDDSSNNETFIYVISQTSTPAPHIIPRAGNLSSYLAPVDTTQSYAYITSESDLSIDFPDPEIPLSLSPTDSQNHVYYAYPFGSLYEASSFTETHSFHDINGSTGSADHSNDYWGDRGDRAYVGTYTDDSNNIFPVYVAPSGRGVNYYVVSQTSTIVPLLATADTPNTAEGFLALLDTDASYTYIYPNQITYSDLILSEDNANDGSIKTTITLTLSSNTFTGSDGADLSSRVTNVPSGLTAVLTKTTDTTATLSFTGNATAHANANDINNLTVTFTDGDFTGGSAAAVTNAIKNNLSLDFFDPAPIPTLSYSSSSFSEANANDGSITATSTITLSDDTFMGANESTLGNVTNVPAGLTAVLTKTTDTTATLSFTGNATAHANANDINNLTVTFADGDFTSGSAADVTNATKNDLSIDFADPSTILNSTNYRTTLFTDGIYVSNTVYTKTSDFYDVNNNGTASTSDGDYWSSDTYSYVGFTSVGGANYPVYKEISGNNIMFRVASQTNETAPHVGNVNPSTNTTPTTYLENIDTGDYQYLHIPNPVSQPEPEPVSQPEPVSEPEPVPQSESAPIPTEKTVDGVLIQETKTTVDGVDTVETILLPITDARVEGDATANKNYADISLGNIGNDAGVTLSIPINIGFQANGIETTQSLKSIKNNLITDIKAIFTTNLNNAILGIENFLSQFNDESQDFFGQQIKLTSDTNQLGNDPIIIDGSHDSNESIMNTFIIDAKDLPTNSLLKLKQIDFAAITGDVSIEAGDEANTLVIGETETEQTIKGQGGDDLFTVGKGSR